MEGLQLDTLTQQLVDKLWGWLTGGIAMLPNIIVAVVVLVVFWYLAKWLSRALHRPLQRFSDNGQINSLVRTTARLVIAGTGLFLALTVLNLDRAVTSMLAGVGVVGLALGFAFQDIAANLMSGVIMAVRRPFRLSDVIRTQDFVGRVEHLDLRATHLRLPSGERVIVPNRKVYSDPIVNLSDKGRLRVSVEVGVSYDDDLSQVREVTEQVVDELDNRMPDEPTDVLFTGFDDSSIGVLIRFWVAYTRPLDMREAVSEAVFSLKQAYDDAGITIPFPIRTLTLGSDETETLEQFKEVA